MPTPSLTGAAAVLFFPAIIVSAVVSRLWTETACCGQDGEYRLPA
jgi:hypothetical protein